MKRIFLIVLDSVGTVSYTHLVCKGFSGAQGTDCEGI